MDEIKRRQDTERVAKAVGACMDRFFEETIPEAMGIKIAVETESTGEYRDGEGVVSMFRFHTPDGGAPIEARMRVDGLGGNVYSAEIVVAGGEAKKCPVMVPRGVPDYGEESPPEDLEIHARELCDCILTELKLVVGERDLRQATEESDA